MATVRSNSLFPKSRAELESAYEAGCAARGSGAHWFSPDTLRFFRSRIADIYYLPEADAWLFITSEQNHGGAVHHPRLYTVRRMDAAGRIKDVGGFQAYATLGRARTALKRASATPWRYESKGNGTTVTVYAPDGRTAFLQGDDAARFLAEAEKTNEKYTDADLCKEYAELLTETPKG